jgi:quercetin dioxygenase-like cupin family protein
MSDAVAVIRQAAEGDRFWFAGGGVFTMKATDAETGGAFVIFEDHVARGKTTPMHLHPDQDEAIHVLDGELLVDVDGRRESVGAGGLFYAPRGVPHAFMVTSETARLLCVLVPGAGESFYREASEPSSSDEDFSRPGDFERLGEVAAASPTIELLGPPPFEPLAAA